jgi:hypothetical protein
MSKLVLNGDTSGSVTLDAPAVSGTTTLTLPTTSGTVLTSGTNTNFPAGSVLQVVQATYSTIFTTASTSYVDTGLSASITPTKSSSKILVIINQMGYLRLDTTAEQGGYANLVRGSTQITEILAYQRMGATAAQYAPYFNGIVYLDSPNTTSSTTYKTQAKVISGASGTQITFNNGSTSTVTLLEIAA